MARMKFLCDAERCIECNGCVTACKQENEIPWGVNRRRVVTINDGVPGERSISVACMHCSDAPCMAVCPVDCFYRTEEGVVLHDKDLCIGCGYCFYACPFGAPQFPQAGAFGVRGKMDKCTFCAGGPEPNNSRGRVQEVRPQPPRRRQAAGLRRDVLDQGAARRRRRRDRRHLPRRASPTRGKGSEVWGWGTAYGRPEAPKQPGAAPGAAAAPRRPREEPNRDPTRVRSIVAGRVAAALRSGSPAAASARRSSSTSRASTRASPTSRRTTSAPWNGNKREWELALAQPQPEPERIQADPLTCAKGGMVSRSNLRARGRARSPRCASPRASRSRSRPRSIRPRRRDAQRAAATAGRRSRSTTSRCGRKSAPARRSSRPSAAARPTC